MPEIKTKQTDSDVNEFIREFVDSEQKRQDSYELLRIMQEFTGFEPKMWGPSIIGFGKYHYKSERSSQQGDWPLVGFSPRKAAISLYIYTGNPNHAHLLTGLGKFKMGKACIYIKRLSDINVEQMKVIMQASIDFLHETYGKID